MFMRKIALLELLLMNCIVLISCRSSPIQPSEESTADTRDRSPRSIWPFASWSGDPTRTDEDDAPVSGPTVGDEDVLLEASNLREYPVWRVHRYHGIDLRPMEIQALSASDRARLLSSVSNEERARDGDAEGGQMISPVDVVHATPGALEITHADGERVSNYVRVAQGEISRTADDDDDERDSTRPDLSFLDDLGGLARFLPGRPEDDGDDASARTTAQNEKVEAPSAVSTGVFDRSFPSKLLGGQTDGAIATVRPVIEDEESEEPGFLGWLFGFGSARKTKRPIETRLTEPADYYYLPGTVGSYVAVKLPANVDSRLKSRLTARLDPRIASFVFDDTASPYSLGHSETPTITAMPTPTTQSVNYSDEVAADNRLQAIRKISDDNLPIRVAVDSHGDDESIKDRETESSKKKIYSGYSKVRHSSDNLTEVSVADSSTSRSI